VRKKKWHYGCVLEVYLRGKERSVRKMQKKIKKLATKYEQSQVFFKTSSEE